MTAKLDMSLQGMGLKKEKEMEGQNISYYTLQEIGCEYDERKALNLCKKKQIANAVLHRSYLDRSCVQVCIYDDRMEVSSLGMLYGGLDLETAKSGNLHVEMKL